MSKNSSVKKKPSTMATRSRTLLYLNFRNSFSKNAPHFKPDVDNSEHAGLIANEIGQSGGEAAVELSVLPPRWVDIVDEVSPAFPHVDTSTDLSTNLHVLV